MSARIESDIHTLSLVTRDKPGVLVRIALVFARRGFNIESLAVSPGVTDGFARMTITSRGAPEALVQIIKQLAKLIDVVFVFDHRDHPAIEAEIALIKVQCSEDQRPAVLQVAQHFAAKLVDCEDPSIVIRVAGTRTEVDSCCSMLKPYNVRELVRSGPIVIDQGASQFDKLLGLGND